MKGDESLLCFLICFSGIGTVQGRGVALKNIFDPPRHSILKQNWISTELKMGTKMLFFRQWVKKVFID